jgi:hypothetical protein
MSSLSIATSAAGCCAYEVGKNTNEDKTMEAVRPVSRAGHLRAMRFGAQVSILVVMLQSSRAMSRPAVSRPVPDGSKYGVSFAFLQASPEKRAFSASGCSHVCSRLPDPGT